MLQTENVTDKESWFITMGGYMKDSGLKISAKEGGMKSFLMGIYT